MIFFLFILALLLNFVINQNLRRILIFGEYNYTIGYSINSIPLDPETTITNYKNIDLSSNPEFSDGMSTKSSQQFWFSPKQYNLVKNGALRNRRILGPHDNRNREDRNRNDREKNKKKEDDDDDEDDDDNDRHKPKKDKEHGYDKWTKEDDKKPLPPKPRKEDPSKQKIKVVKCKRGRKYEIDKKDCKLQDIDVTISDKKLSHNSNVDTIQLDLSDGSLGLIESSSPQLDLKNNDIYFLENGEQPIEGSWKEKLLLDSIEPAEDYSNKANLVPGTAITINNQNFLIKYYTNNNLVKLPFESFSRKLQEKKILIITDMTSTTGVGKDIPSLALAYGNSYLALAFEGVSYEIPYTGFREDKWIFVSASIDYSISKISVALISGSEIIKIDLKTEKSYVVLSNSILNVGGFTEKIKESINNHCDCIFNYFHWSLMHFVDDISFILDFRRTLLKPIFLGNFKKSLKDQVLYGRQRENYYIKELPGTKASTLQLGSTLNEDIDDPYYEPYMLALLFDGTKQAIFDPGYQLYQNDRFEITFSFWFKHTGKSGTKSSQILWRNENLNRNNFMSIEFDQVLSSVESKIFVQTIRVWIFNKYTTTLTFNSDLWNFLMVRVMTIPGSIGLMVNVDIINDKIKLKSSDFIPSPADITYLAFKLKLQSIQKFALAPTFQGYIKLFTFYHGSLITNDVALKGVVCENCLICHCPRNYMFLNVTLSGIFKIYRECFICSDDYIKIDNKCVPKSTVCPVESIDFKKQLNLCESCPSCTAPECGDGKREGNEICDDGQKNKSLSMCTENCDGVKAGFKCTDNWLNTYEVKDICSPDCGDEIIIPPEECDRGKTSDPGCIKCKLTPGYFCTVSSCVVCSEQCLSCLDATQCSKCEEKKYLSIEGKCLSMCPLDYYGDSNFKCITCSTYIPFCYTCKSSTICTKCSSSYSLLNTDLAISCVLNCPNGTFSSGGVCRKCPANCDVCTSESICKTCSVDYAKLGQTCTTNCGNRFYNEKTTRTCEKCLDYCLECNESKNCITCDGFYYLSSEKTQCGNACPKDEISGDDRKCVKCNNYFPNYNCQTCEISGCITCLNSNEFIRVNKTCGECEDQYYGIIATRKCVQCPPLCSKCQDLSGTMICLECIKNSYLSEETKICMEKCIDGYYPDPTLMKCLKCQVLNCMDCNKDPSKCSKCSNGFAYYNPYTNTCNSKIPPEYYEITEYTLEKCKKKCQVCTSTACNECTSNTVLHLNNCIDTCPTGYSQIAGKCEICKVSNCFNCSTNNNECDLCSPGYYYNTKTLKCATNCGNVPLYYDLENRKCEYCKITNCNCCRESPNVCDACLGEYVLSNNLCIASCPTGFGEKTYLDSVFQCSKLTQKHIDYKICIKCEDSRCIKCQNDPANCIRCTPQEPRLYILEGKCVDTSPVNYYIANDENGLLKKCPNFCSMCADRTGYCTGCIDKNYKLEKYICVQVCPDSLISEAYAQNCNKPCEEGSPCYTDSEGCLNLIKQRCIQCNNPFFIDKMTGKCVPFCSINGYYIKKISDDTSQCIPCDSSCSQCNEKGCTVCEEKTLNKLAVSSDGKNICLSTCPSNTFEDKSSHPIRCVSCQVKDCIMCPLNEKCTQCKNDLLLLIRVEINENSCVINCPDGYYKPLTANECSKCKVDKCAKCNDISCQKCIKELSLQGNICKDKCDSGYYSSNGICMACRSECLTCNIENSCETCPINKYLFLDVSGYYTCELLKEGYYVDGTTQKQEKCLDNCKICTKFNDCLEPFDAYYYEEESKTMIDKCNDNSYIDTPNKICKSCANVLPHCVSCIKTTKIECQQCEKLFLLQLNVCVEKCSISFAKNNKKCDPCPLNAEVCYFEMSPLSGIINIVITKCLENFYLMPNNTCISSGCPKEYFYETRDNKCHYCTKDCKSCQDSLYCNECSPSFYLSYGRDKCTKECNLLNNEFNGDNFYCVKCKIENCDQCSNLSECLNCSNGYFRLQLSDSVINCAKDLPSGYFLDKDNIFKKCSETNCLNCNNTHCLNCDLSFILSLDQMKCIASCLPGQYNEISLNQCKLCPENCAKCENSNKCTQCFQNYYLFKEHCYQSCIDNYFPDKTTGICALCSSNCLKCDSFQVCQKCDIDNSFYLDPEKRNCIHKGNIPLGYFADIDSGTIHQCLIESCRECISKTLCSSCFEGLFWDLLQKKCTDFCSKSYGKNSETKKCELCSDNLCEQCDFNLSKCSKCVTKTLLNIESYTCVTKCEKGYFLLNAETCAKCSSGCSICDNSGNCQQCDENYIKYNGNCINEANHPACPLCLNENSPCPQKTFRSERECFDCQDYCTKCTNTKCFECQRGYKLNENQCFKICPQGKGLINDPVKNECVNCAEYCVDCASLNKCSNCSTGFELNTNGLCNLKPKHFIKPNEFKALPCSNNCLSCKNESLCEECDFNNTLLNNKCFQNCSKSNFMDNSGKCIPCSENCISCSNLNKCHQCLENYILSEDRCKIPKCPLNCEQCSLSECLKCFKGYMQVDKDCKKCDELKGFDKNCNEICGDGYLYNSILSGHDCDDGNNINGDGCDENCKKENYFYCNRVNFTTPDNCYDTRPFNLSFYTSNEEDKAFIKPARPIKFINNEELARKINIEIKELNNSIYNYSVFYDEIGKIIVIQFFYNVSVQNINMMFKLKRSRLLEENNPNSLVDILTDVNGIAVEEKYYNEATFVELNSFTVYSQSQKNQIQALITANQPTTITFMVSTGPLYLFNAFSFFWLMVDCIQVANFFLYVNIVYPKNLVEFLKILSAANFKFLPNPFDSITSQNNSTKNELVNQQAPFRFDSLDLTSSFLENAGSQLIIILIPVIIYFFIVPLDNRNIAGNKEGKLPIYTKKIREGLEFGGLLRFYLMVFLQLTFGCFLQIENISMANSFNVVSSILGIIVFICICSIFIILFKIVINMKRNEDLAYNKKFEVLYEDYQTNNFIQLNFPVISMLKKFFMILILVLLHDYPLIELIALISLYTISTFIVLLGRPFKRRLTNFIIIITELAFIAVFSLFIYLEIIGSEETRSIVPIELIEKRVLIGWIVVIIISSVLFMYFIVYFRQQILAIRDLLVYLKDFKIKYNDYLKSLFRKKNKRESNQSNLSSTLSTVIVDKSIDEVDEKYLNLENAPETSFSKYYKTMKSKRSTIEPTISSRSSSDNIGESMLKSLNSSEEQNSFEKKKEILRQTIKKLKETKIIEEGLEDEVQNDKGKK